MGSRIYKYLFITLAATLSQLSASAQNYNDTVAVYFRQGQSNIDRDLLNNNQRLDSITTILNHLNSDSGQFQITDVKVEGTASPEGAVSLNNRLSVARANKIKNFISKTVSLPAGVYSVGGSGRDWTGLYALIAADKSVPGRDEALNTVSQIITEVNNGNPQPENLIQILHSMNNGVTYRYIYTNLYPFLRTARVEVEYAKRLSLLNAVEYDEYFMPQWEENFRLGEVEIVPQVTRKPFYMALKTNLLYDVAAIPNIGAEFYVGKNLTIGADWMYGWWDVDKRHRYWRAYGGNIVARWWFGSRAQEKPLTGHHIGVFGGIVTYDFEFGHEGYMGGKPGGTLWDRCNQVAGIEYGYSLPLGRRLNMDFTIGLGYMGGKYIKYKPENSRYVWESTHRLSWWGPVKAEVSLVWLIGRGNYNTGKGGSR